MEPLAASITQGNVRLSGLQGSIDRLNAEAPMHARDHAACVEACAGSLCRPGRSAAGPGPTRAGARAGSLAARAAL
mgnify:CR=1 FL=1